MDKLISDMTIGIVSGLFTTLLVLVIDKFWRNTLLPWYEERVYQDVHFEGDWDATETYSDTTSPLSSRFKIEIKRIGHKVTATSTCCEGPDMNKMYILEGSFKNLILTLTWHPKDNSSLERGTIAAKLIENGTRFEGHGVFYSPKTEKVHTSIFVAKPYVKS